MMNLRAMALCALVLSTPAVAGVFYKDGATTLHFAFEGSPNGDRPIIRPPAHFQAEDGFGFVDSPGLIGTARGVTAPRYFRFDVTVPAGTYDISVTLGGTEAESITRIKAENRATTVQEVRVAPRESVLRTFTVTIQPAARNSSALESDGRINLEFEGVNPSLMKLDVKRRSEPVTKSGLAPLPLEPDLVVAADGSGDFTSIHEAVQSVPPGNRERTIILVKQGVYTEQVRVDAACITLRGESRTGTRLEFSRANTDRTPGRGQAVLNLSATAHDFVLENFTVKNTHGQLGIHAFAIFGLADRTVLLDADVLSQGNDTLSLWRGRADDNAPVTSTRPDGTTTVWHNGGRYYHARLTVCGSVDFICPRGWCFMRDSIVTAVNPTATAAIWHDGSNDADQKFVLRQCTFDGPPDWTLARRHHDAQFFLLDCTFSKAMRDKAPYRVIYPLHGGSPSEADRKRNADYDRTNVRGERAYFFHARREGGDYPWHRDNLASAPGAPEPDQITAAWTFANSWDPERTDAPRVVSLRHDAQPDKLVVTFNEAVTVRGRPRLAFANGEFAEFRTGSGTNALEFSSPNAAFGGTVPKFELNGAAIFSTEAGARLRMAMVEFGDAVGFR